MSLLGPRAKGTTRGGALRGSPGAITSAKLDHSQSGDPAVVAQRDVAAKQGGMLKNILKKSKSSGIKP